ncbi:hypothetical protein BOX15_Mlig007433g1, partial [Macrostomum lignano]
RGWLEDRQPRPQRPPTEPGFCQAFKPNVCRNYLGGSRVFVTDNTYQYTMERLLVQLLAKLADAVDPSCVQPLTQAICHFNFPLCAENPASFNPDGLSASPQRLCIADCQAAVGGRCQRHFEILRTSLDYLRRGGSGDRDIFAGRSSGVVDLVQLLPDCDSLPTERCVSMKASPPPTPPPPPPQPPPVRPPLSTSADPADCYNVTQPWSYSGRAATSRSGRVCLAWAGIPGYAQLAGHSNWCRGSAGDPPAKPWCFVTETGEQEDCDVPQCGDGSNESRQGSKEAAGPPPPMSAREMLPVFVSLGALACLAAATLLVCCFCRRAAAAAAAASGSSPNSLRGGGEIGGAYRGLLKRQLIVGGPPAVTTLPPPAPPPTPGEMKRNRQLQQQQQQSLQPPAAQVREFSLSQIRFGEEIGESAFGKVYKGELIGLYSDTSLTPVAIKCLSAAADARTQAEFGRDTQARWELRHPNLVCLLGASLRQTPLAQLQETLPHGDLHEFLIYHSPAACDRLQQPQQQQQQQDYSEPGLSSVQLLHLASQVAAGLEYLASRGVVHKDVAARNVLLGDGLQCKLGDLGAARDLYSCDYYRLQGRCLLPIRWLPPEAILYGQFSAQTDVYSFGVLLWEMWSHGLQPYYGYSNSEVIELVRQRQLLPCPPGCPPALAGVLLDCWAEAPGLRPSPSGLHERLRQRHSELLAELAATPASQQGSGQTSSTGFSYQQQQQQQQQQLDTRPPSQRVIPVPVPGFHHQQQQQPPQPQSRRQHRQQRRQRRRRSPTGSVGSAASAMSSSTSSSSSSATYSPSSFSGRADVIGGAALYRPPVEAPQAV